MKKITNFLTLLLLALCSIGASAETATLTYSNIQVYKGGNLVTPTASYTYNHQVRSTTTPLITISIGTGDVVYNTSKFCFGNNNRTYTLAIDGDYVITGFRINYTTGSGVRFTSNGVESNDDGQLAVSGLSSASTTFLATWINGVGTSGSWQNYSVTSIEVDYEQPNTDWVYTYTQYDATTFASLGTGTVSVTATSAGYIPTPPSVAGYAFLGAADPGTATQLDITKPITATNLAFIYSPILQNIASASSSKAYTITTPRGYIHATSADATQFGVTSLSAGTADLQNPLHQWTFVTLDGNTYLYNVGTKKLASFNAIRGHDLVTSAPATVAGTASTFKDGYPVVLSFSKGSTTYTMNITAVPAVQIDGWTQHDDGNVLQIVEVPILTVAPEVYSVTFTCSGGGLTSVYVDGAELALGTPIVLTSGATVSSVSTGINTIATYNGFSTLAEALADASFDGTVDVALATNISDITINVMRGSTVVKTVTVTDVPEGTPVDVASLVGTPTYVTDLTPATIIGTTENQAVDVTYTSTLPFSISDDPESPDATAYLMTLRERYAYGSATATNFDLDNQAYYWTFGGDEFNGITVYNKANGYMSVGSTTDNSVATFSTTPTPFTVKPNTNQTDGFNLNIPGTNAYINLRGNNVSTWLDTRANGEVGSCLKVYSIDEAVTSLIEDLTFYFAGAGAFLNALTVDAAQQYEAAFNQLLQTPDYAAYKTLRDNIAAAPKVQATEGYYAAISAYDGFMKTQGETKTMFYNATTDRIEWHTAASVPAEIVKLEVAPEDNTRFVLASAYADKYLATNKGLTTSDKASALTFEVLPGKPAAVVLAYNPTGGTDAAIHANGHNNGAGVSGTLTNWVTTTEPSMWRFLKIDIPEITLVAPEGVADGEEVVQTFAHTENVQMPLTAGVYTISEEFPTGARLDTVTTGQIAAATGYIISGTKGKVVPLLPLDGVMVEVPSGNLLVAGEGTVVNGGFMLAYKKGDSQAKFWTINNLTVPRDRAYLPEGTPTAGLENIFGGLGDDITGISGVTTGNENSAIYDLQGRRVSKATKGVYIIGGKKVVK